MKSGFALAAYTARLGAGITQTKASELIDLSLRSVQKYENGEQVPTDPVVARMVAVYGSPALGYFYLANELATGRLILPPMIVSGVSSKSIRLRVAVDHVKALLPELDAICLDDFVDEAEKGTLAGNISKFRELASACMGIQMMAGVYAKEKDAFVGAKTS
jgi:transcriptional regulator with XRE-family HTH domain